MATPEPAKPIRKKGGRREPKPTKAERKAAKAERLLEGARRDPQKRVALNRHNAIKRAVRQKRGASKRWQQWKAAANADMAAGRPGLGPGVQYSVPDAAEGEEPAPEEAEAEAEAGDEAGPQGEQQQQQQGKRPKRGRPAPYAKGTYVAMQLVKLKMQGKTVNARTLERLKAAQAKKDASVEKNAHKHTPEFQAAKQQKKADFEASRGVVRQMMALPSAQQAAWLAASYCRQTRCPELEAAFLSKALIQPLPREGSLLGRLAAGVPELYPGLACRDPGATPLGSPTGLIVSHAASNANELWHMLGELRRQPGAQVPKLFAKHIKQAEQVGWLQRGGPFGMAVCTPHRAATLAEAGALHFSRLRLLLFDATVDQKDRTMLDMPESQRDFWGLVDAHLKPRLEAGSLKIAFISLNELKAQQARECRAANAPNRERALAEREGKKAEALAEILQAHDRNLQRKRERLERRQAQRAAAAAAGGAGSGGGAAAAPESEEEEEAPPPAKCRRKEAASQRPAAALAPVASEVSEEGSESAEEEEGDESSKEGDEAGAAGPGHGAFIDGEAEEGEESEGSGSSEEESEAEAAPVVAASGQRGRRKAAAVQKLKRPV